MHRPALLLGFALLGLLWLSGSLRAERSARPCPADMVHVKDFCIDRYEASVVDDKTGRPLSPYYPPHNRLMKEVHRAWEHWRLINGSEAARAMPLPPVSDWQSSHHFEPRAVSRFGAVPQGYTSYFMAKSACEKAGKRLCRESEWKRACRGQEDRQFPYGDKFSRGPCNVYRYFHPAHILHGVSWRGLLDPRLNLLTIASDAPVLRLTGASQGCASRFGKDAVMDMVGNLDEWVEEDEPRESRGMFRGGFYARGTTKGCDSEITNHAKLYYDYSTGIRCCRAER